VQKIIFVTENFSKISQKLLDEKIAILHAGSIFGFSVFPENFSKIFKIKNRSEKNPFLLIFPDFSSVEKIVEFSDFSRQIGKKIWPGNFSLILPRKKNILPFFFPNFTKLGVRIPKNKILRDFLKFIKKPLISTSVNFSGQKPLQNFYEINNQFGKFSDIFFVQPENNFSISQDPSSILEISGEKIIWHRGKKTF